VLRALAGFIDAARVAASDRAKETAWHP
jgi:hypothetical protein